MIDLLRFARANGVLTSMDPVVKPGISDIIIPCLPYLDVFLPNSDESFHITGLKEPEEQLRFYLDAGVRLVGIKIGGEGCLISNGKDIFQVSVSKIL